MKILPIFKPDQAIRPMRVAAFMSGSGTNIIKLLELEKKLKSKEGASPFKVVFIFSDRADGSCRGEQIAYENGIPYFSYDIRAFYRRRKAKRTVVSPEGLALRKKFDSVATKLVKSFKIDLNALGGYMSYTTLDRCINVHPADLSILTPEGKRRFVGDHAVMDALLAGERSLASSTIWTDRGIDTGPLLMVSNPLEIQISESPESLARDRGRLMKIVKEYQKRLKKEGDWQIFPRTIEMIARGRFALDEDNRVYVDGLPVPNGYRKEPHPQDGASSSEKE